MSSVTFKRNQVEEAIWLVMSNTPAAAPPIFLTRLKRLLETDRKFRHKKIRGVVSAECAFSELSTEGKGFEAEFSGFDAFCLGLGFDMLDAGYNPKEIVFLIRHIRKDLASEYKESLRCPVAPRQFIDPADRPGCPTFVHKGHEYADCRRFLVLQKIVVTEALHGAAGKGKREREERSKRTVIEVKEMKFRPKTDEHDFDFKVKHIREFLGEGNKAKLVIQFRGREIVHPEVGQNVLRRVVEACNDVGQVEQHPMMEGRRMIMIIGPKSGQRPPQPRPPAPSPLSAVQAQAAAPAQAAPAQAAPAVVAAAPAGSRDE